MSPQAVNPLADQLSSTNPYSYPMKKIIFALFLLPLVVQAKVQAPKPYGPVPSERQLQWHDLNFYAFVHFTTNTFNDLEWGYGDANPDIFCPDQLDAEQWCKALKAAGMKGVILTAKHHDGFCLWPSAHTDYSVKNSRWRNGQGDVVLEVSKAAKKYGLKFGVYLSPWDRHDLRYGTPDYITYYRAQLRELLTNYGPIFELWEDGANGGDGYYGGSREQRRIDNRTYYDWKNTNFIIRELQPKACIFSDGGPDVRWCGNESGHVGDTNWCTIHRADFAPGRADAVILHQGDEDGTDWVPAEVDVSIRPGWFFHEKENDKVKTPSQLLDIYYNSIGRGANLILNVPANKQGLFGEQDVAALEGFGKEIEAEFSNCVNKQISKADATNVRGGDKAFEVRKVLDGKKNTYWATDDDVKEAYLTFHFRQPTSVNRVKLQEYIPLGQRVEKYTVETLDKEGKWQKVAQGTTIGYKRLLRFETVEAKAIRVGIVGKACPTLSNVEFYCRK